MFLDTGNLNELVVLFAGTECRFGGGGLFQGHLYGWSWKRSEKVTSRKRKIVIKKTCERNGYKWKNIFACPLVRRIANENICYNDGQKRTHAQNSLVSRMYAYSSASVWIYIFLYASPVFSFFIFTLCIWIQRERCSYIYTQNYPDVYIHPRIDIPFCYKHSYGSKYSSPH